MRRNKIFAKSFVFSGIPSIFASRIQTAGCSSVRLECWSGGPKVAGSSPVIPTKEAIAMRLPLFYSFSLTNFQSDLLIFVFVRNAQKRFSSARELTKTYALISYTLPVEVLGHQNLNQNDTSRNPCLSNLSRCRPANHPVLQSMGHDQRRQTITRQICRTERQ